MSIPSLQMDRMRHKGPLSAEGLELAGDQVGIQSRSSEPLSNMHPFIHSNDGHAPLFSTAIHSL